ncbi:hypothetical protein ACQE3D_09650 [Methylomonas sp. MS20]|uniref:hypothetical protein n=1 Tax=unclassified Methylomonas TaxID=2608980 RepID=UPI0028A4F6E0|nr:hypothetical protein [Methylomonas sp. MV1]MDT4328737.1 hypothetical protein [Methylomonas sp. MV1]
MTDLNLKIKIAGDASQAEQSVGRVEKALRGLDSTGKNINDSFAKSFLTGLAGGVSIAGITSLIKESVNAADALNDMADRSGIAVEKLAGLEYATKVGDTTLGAFVASSNKLSINIAKNADDFAKLGVTAKDPVEAFKQFADVFAGIADPQQRAAVGAAALGKSYAEMAPLLMMGANGVQELIDTGRQHNPITAEQAQNAGLLNDRLTELGDRSKYAALLISGPLVSSLNEIGSALDFATEKSKGFHPLDFLTDYANGSNTDDKLGRLNLQIGEITQSIIDLKAAGVRGGRGFVASNLGEMEAELAKLQKMREALQPKPEPSSAVAAFDAALAQKFIDKFHDEETAASSAESAVKALDNAYQSAAQTLRQQIALHGDTSAAAQMEFEVQSGALSKLDESRKLILLNLAAEKDAVMANIEAYKEYDGIIEQGLALAGKQRAAQSDQYARLFDRFNPGYNTLTQGIADVDQAKALGLIDADRAKAEYDKLGKAYNDGFIEPAMTATDQLSEFSGQAARNIQSDFADFLFDPFADGTQDMAKGFGDALRKMAAESATANIFNSLLGKDFGKSGQLGGLLGSFGSVISGAFGGGGSTFQGNGPLLSYQNHKGGMAGSTPYRAFDADVFSGAPRFHGGGGPGLAANEVPSILLRGEEVLTADDPRHINNLGKSRSGGVTINVINQADGAKATATSRQVGDEMQIDILIQQIEKGIAANMSRGLGLAPILERQYALNRAAGSF